MEKFSEKQDDRFTDLTFITKFIENLRRNTALLLQNLSGVCLIGTSDPVECVQ